MSTAATSTAATSEATTSKAKDAQLAAIEQSGWGVPFRFFQPHNLAFWVYLLGVGGGALTMVQGFGPRAGFYAVALSGGVLLFGLYVVPWLLLLHWHNRYTSQPAALLAAAFVWGGIAAPFWIALPANTALLAIWAKVGGTGFATLWGAGLTAPINEEWGKALGFVVILLMAPRLVRSAYDGFIIGAYVGLGFQVFEDILYVYNSAAQAFGVNQAGAAIQVFLLRGLVGIVSHTLFSAIFCAGLMWVLTRVPGERHVGRGVLTMLMAMIFHFTWDDTTGLAARNGVLAFALMPVLAAVELVALFFVLRHAASTERAWTRDLLQPEVDAGLVEPELLDAVAGLRKDRSTYRRRLHDRRAARHRVDAAHDLAREIALAGGSDTHGVSIARAQLERLHQHS